MILMKNKENLRKKVGMICMILGALLLGAAGTLLLYNRAEDRRASEAVENVLPKVRSAISEDGEDSDDMKIVEIDGYGYIGYLSIPALGLELPVMSEWDYERLQMAPCLHFGSVKTNDMVIAGHNYTKHFGMLSSLKTGDGVIFEDMRGKIYYYEVVCLETIQPTATEEMIQSQWDLSLYTCTYSGQSRVTVRCRKVKR